MITGMIYYTINKFIAIGIIAGYCAVVSTLNTGFILKLFDIPLLSLLLYGFVLQVKNI